MRAPMIHTRRVKHSPSTPAGESRRNWRVYRPRQLVHEGGGSAATRAARLREYHVLDQRAEARAGTRSLHRAEPFFPHRDSRVFVLRRKSWVALPVGLIVGISVLYKRSTISSDWRWASPDARALWGAIMLAGRAPWTGTPMDRCGEARTQEPKLLLMGHSGTQLEQPLCAKRMQPVISQRERCDKG
jgi:hypothetical protein